MDNRQKPKLFVTRALPEGPLEGIKEIFEISIFSEDRPPTKKEILSGIKDADYLICLLTDEISEDIIKSAKNLKGIANYAVGYDNINVEVASALGIPVTNTPDVLTEATADLTWMLILGIARRVIESDRLVRSHNFGGWAPLLLLGSDVFQKTLGIVGMGRIGEAVAKRAKGFEMKVLFYNRTPKPEFEHKYGWKQEKLETVLRESDFVSIHLAYSTETHEIMNIERLKLMKPSAYLINTARGKNVDEKALITALQTNVIHGAALDVFYNEPAISEELAKLDNLLLSAHTGSATVEARTKMAEIAVGYILAMHEGRTPPNKVN